MGKGKKEHRKKVEARNQKMKAADNAVQWHGDSRLQPRQGSKLDTGRAGDCVDLRQDDLESGEPLDRFGNSGPTVGRLCIR